jgi:glutamyl-tRNA synthetase
MSYRGRLAPSPTGLLHLGHARTFWVAQARARARGGMLVLRNEDLDATRFKLEFVDAMLEDLRWFGFDWQEGPGRGGPCAPYAQSERMPLYRDALERLLAGGLVYRCTCTRKDIQSAIRAPHATDDQEPIYPGLCRDKAPAEATGRKFSWRFRVKDGEAVGFEDGHFGPQQFVAGTDFGDFVVWRNDGLPSYQLACVVDDSAMRISEVVRGSDLLLSTARQLLLYRALGLQAPAFYHCDLMNDDHGERLAKRHDALSLKRLREGGATPEALRRGWDPA